MNNEVACYSNGLDPKDGQLLFIFVSNARWGDVYGC